MAGAAFVFSALWVIEADASRSHPLARVAESRAAFDRTVKAVNSAHPAPPPPPPAVPAQVPLLVTSLGQAATGESRQPIA